MIEIERRSREYRLMKTVRDEVRNFIFGFCMDANIVKNRKLLAKQGAALYIAVAESKEPYKYLDQRYEMLEIYASRHEIGGPAHALMLLIGNIRFAELELDWEDRNLSCDIPEYEVPEYNY